jgi:hypothetical protein
VKRREFITLLGGAAVAWPLAARAQQPGKLPIIGFLGANTPSVQSHWIAAFVQRLRELGWIEGRNVAIEYRCFSKTSFRPGSCRSVLSSSLPQPDHHGRTVRVQLDLRGLRTILWSGSRRRLKRLLLNQQAFGLEQKLKVDDGLHPGPLVPDSFETLQYVWPLVAPTAQDHLSNEPHGVVCAAQNPLRVRADAQLRINRKVQHA